MDKRSPAVTPPAPEPADAGRSRIFIGADGEVVVENLTPALLEVALALDPGDSRLRAIARAAAEPAADPVAPAPEDPSRDGEAT